MLLILICAALNGLRGGGFPRGLATLLMAFAWQQSYWTLLMWGLLWAAFTPGWSLGAISGTRDWGKKFKPAGFVDSWKDWRLAGAVGMSVRWLLFLAAVVLAHGIPFTILAGLPYWAAGKFLKRDQTRAAEIVAGALLGASLVGVW